MKFLGRLKYYGLGLGLGVVMVFFMFGTRGCDWTPTKRVKSTLQSCRVSANPCLLECSGITNESIYELIYNGKVNFKDSETKGEPKNYVLYNDDVKIGLELNVYDSIAKLTDVYLPKSSCNCSDDVQADVNLPKQYVFEKLMKKGFEFSPKNRCEMACFNLSEEDVLSINVDSEIDYTQSLPYRKPNPGYAVIKTINGKQYLFAIEDGYKARVNTIVEIGVEKNCDC